MRGARGLGGFIERMQVLVRAQLRAPVLVHHHMARRLVEQRARLGDRCARLLHRQHPGVALLHDVGSGIAVAHLAQAEVQQFSVVVDEHGAAARQGDRRDIAVLVQPWRHAITRMNRIIHILTTVYI